MSEKNGVLRIHPKAREAADENTSIYLNEIPMMGTKDQFKAFSIGSLVCGVCGGHNAKLIHYTSGATSDGTVVVKELQCLDCEHYTTYWFSDRM